MRLAIVLAAAALLGVVSASEEEIKSLDDIGEVFFSAVFATRRRLTLTLPSLWPWQEMNIHVSRMQDINDKVDLLR